MLNNRFNEIESAEVVCKEFSKDFPDYAKISELIDDGRFEPQQLAYIANSIILDCTWDYRIDDNNDIVDDRRKMHLNNVITSMELLLDKGLNPNCWDCNEETAMFSIQYMADPVTGPQLLKLLLENGGNPNLKLRDNPEEETVFEYVNFKVGENCCGPGNSGVYENLVKCWLLLITYGGRFNDGGYPLELLGNMTLEQFKDIENYRFEIEEAPRPGHSPYMNMYIFDNRTGEKVARY